MSGKPAVVSLGSPEILGSLIQTTDIRKAGTLQRSLTGMLSLHQPYLRRGMCPAIWKDESQAANCEGRAASTPLGYL